MQQLIRRQKGHLHRQKPVLVSLGGQNALGFQVPTLDSGKVKYFGYTLGGSSEMSSAGELTVSSREKSIAARERANQKAGSAASAPSLTSSSQLHIAVARTYISGSKVASPAGQAKIRS